MLALFFRPIFQFFRLLAGQMGAGLPTATKVWAASALVFLCATAATAPQVSAPEPRQAALDREPAQLPIFALPPMVSDSAAPKIELEKKLETQVAAAQPKPDKNKVEQKKKRKKAGRIVLGVFIGLLIAAAVGAALFFYLGTPFGWIELGLTAAAAVAAVLLMGLIVWLTTIPNRAKRIRRRWRWFPDWAGSLLAVLGFAGALVAGAYLVKTILALTLAFSELSLMAALILLPALAVSYVTMVLIQNYIRKNCR